MFQNKKYGFCALTLCLTGLAYCFVCAGLENGLGQILGSFISPAGGGWTPEQLDRPMIVGAALAVPMAFVWGVLCLRSGVRQSLILTAAAAALGCVGLVDANGLDIYGGASSGHYGLFFCSLALTRCACTVTELGVFALAVNWSIRYRGRMLGLITLGGPLFSAVGAAAIVETIRTRLWGDYRPFFLCAAGLLAALALSTRFLLRDRPEDGGLYPDGDGRAPAGEPEELPAPFTVGQVLRHRRTWLLLAVYGAYITAAAGCMGSLEERFMALGGETVWSAAGPWLALGAILGIPASYIFGWLCDKLGAERIGPILGVALLIPPVVLWAMPAGGSTWLEIVWCLGAACLIGGLSTVLPCAIAQAFGRGQYLAASRVLMPLLLIPPAVMPAVARQLVSAGQARSLYLCLAGTAALGLILSPLLRYVRAPGGERR